MATDQFIYLLERLHKSAQLSPLPWQPTATLQTFKIGLGEGSVRLRLEDDSHYAARSIMASLLNEEGRTIDELEAGEFESEHFKWLLDLHQQAHATAFRLSQVIDSMLGDLEQGKFRVLPPEQELEDDGIPF